MTDETASRTKKRVAVLFGGQSDEHDVSLRSAQTIINALDPAKYDVIPLGITREGRWLAGDDPMRALTAVSPMFQLNHGGDGMENGGAASAPISSPPSSALAAHGGTSLPTEFAGSVDIVFPAIHGPMGEDGTVQGFLELTGVPYIGSGVLGSAAAMDKAFTKHLLTQAGLPQLPWVQVLRRDWELDPEAIEAMVEEKLGFPSFVKPANMGSSVGVSKARNAEELHAGLRTAALYDRKIVVEQGLNAREIELAVLGNDDPIVSVAGEVVPAGEFYDYNAKYIDDDAQLLIPAEIAPDLLLQMQQMAIDAFHALDLAGMARVDFFVERETDRIFVNEINTIPGFTSISMYPMLWQASGVPLGSLVERLIELGLERSAENHR